jgi:hypothetical protein
MVKDGLVAVSDVEVIRYAPRAAADPQQDRQE